MRLLAVVGIAVTRRQIHRHKWGRNLLSSTLLYCRQTADEHERTVDFVGYTGECASLFTFFCVVPRHVPQHTRICNCNRQTCDLIRFLVLSDNRNRKSTSIIN